MMFRKVVLFMALILPLALWACLNFQQAVSREKPDSGGQHNVNNFDFTLVPGEGKALVSSAEPTNTNCTPLETDSKEKLLQRLPALPKSTSLQQEFKRRADSIPAPRGGQTVQVSFPPREEMSISYEQTIAPTAPPTVLERFSPEGAVQAVPGITLTFSQPIIELSGVDVSDALIPAQIKPEVKGHWRWLGTKTAIFEPADHHMPMSSKFEVTVPANLKDVAGRSLAKEYKFSFQTEKLKFAEVYPNGRSVGPTPVCYAIFNQRIDSAKLRNQIALAQKGLLSARVGLEFLSLEQLPKDSQAYKVLKEAPQGRWLAFRPSAPLKADTDYSIILLKGSSALEGPLTTEAEQSISFKTFEPLQIVSTNADQKWRDGKLSVYDKWYINFNNDLDAKGLKVADLVKSVSPKLEGMNVSIVGASLIIGGEVKAQTNYTVKLSPEICDIYAQKLGSKAKAITFKIGQLEAYINAPGGRFNILDPNSPTVYSVYTGAVKEFKAKLFRVNFADFSEKTPLYFKNLGEYTGAGKLVWEKNFKVKASPNEYVQTPIDVAQAFTNGPCLALLAIEAGSRKDYTYFSKAIWLQASSLAVDSVGDNRHTYIYVTDLKTGQAVSGATVEVQGHKASTDASGRAVLPVLSSNRDEAYILVSQGKDKVLAPVAAGNHLLRNAKNVIFNIFDDRGLYRPGETVSVKGWLRSLDVAPEANVKLAPNFKQVNWKLLDPRGAAVANGSTTVSACGGFDFQITLPENINLGDAELILSLPESDSKGWALSGNRYDISIQEFRRPEFEVVVKTDAADYFMDDRASVEAKTSYFAGGVLTSSPIIWRANSKKASYNPPGWDGFTFGQWRPWWGRFWDEANEETVSHSLEVSTDSLGKSAIDIDLGRNLPPTPVTLSVSAAVSDVNRQTWSGSTSFLVHPADLYVGIKADKFSYQQLVKPNLDFIVTTLDGKAVPKQKISLQIARIETVYDSEGQAQEKEMDVINDELISADKSVQKAMPFSKPGLWRVRAQVRDEQGRLNESTVRLWIGNFQAADAIKDKVEAQKLTLIPDRQEYLPGQVAEIAVQAPFVAKHGIYTISRNGIAKSEAFKIDGTNALLQIPIDKNWLPGFQLKVSVSGADSKADLAGNKLKGTSRPAYATASLDLSVSTREKKLQVKAEPKDLGLEPGGQTEVTVSVVDCDNKPVAGAEVALVVVDDSIWALSGYSIEDPIKTFYAKCGPYTTAQYMRSLVLLNSQNIDKEQGMTMRAVGMKYKGAKAEGIFMMNSAQAPMMAQAARSVSLSEITTEDAYDEAASADSSSGASNSVIALRFNFNPLAIFAAALQTDSNGKITQKVTLPDNLTRYRVVAVAADKDSRFGLGESSLTARLPLMVRPSAPRFLNFGDKFSLPVVLHNQTAQDMRVQVAARAANVKVLEPGAYTCQVPAQSRREVLIPMETEQAGQAVIQVAAASGRYADSAQCKLPVYTPCTTEGFATYGTVDGEQTLVQPMQRPKDSFTQFGGLEISTSSTALQELTDAVIYLCEYPFNCSEQLASRIIVLANLNDVLRSFKAEGLPSQEKINGYMASSLKELQKRQSYDGGFGFWTADKSILPFVSVHCAQALVSAKAHGFKVDEKMYDRALKYAAKAYDKTNSRQYSRQARLNVAAYADNVLWQAGRDVTKNYTELKKEDLSKVYLDTLGWYLPVIKDKFNDQALVAEIKRQINNKVVETAGKANIGTFEETNDGYLILSSNFRNEAVVLSALMYDEPKSSVIPKLVRSLLDGRRRGHWSTTQDNAMVVMALDKYFRTYEAVTPDFAVNMWLGADYVGQHKYQGRSNEYQISDVPMSVVPEKGNVTLEKKGQGRLYYRLGLKYALKDLTPEPLEAGFAVVRTYEGADDPNDVQRIDANTWQFKLGSRVRCTTKLVAPARRAHVALSVPLPAGCEILNSALKMTEDLPEDQEQVKPKYYWSYFWRSPFDHQNLRDDKAEAFSLILPGGEYEYSFVCRATAPGTFVVPPAKAEEMYAPEVFGRSGGVKVIIK